MTSTQTLIHTAATAASGLMFCVGLFGAWLWWSVKTSRLFWYLLRLSQGVTGLFVVFVGVAVVFFGYEPRTGLFWVYVLLPVLVSFFAEQLRVLSAQTVLETRGYKGIEAFRQADAERQRSVALAITRRETGVMVLAAFVMSFLLLRSLFSG